MVKLTVAVPRESAKLADVLGYTSCNSNVRWPLTCNHAQQVHLWTAAQHDAEGKQDPRQVGCREVEDTQETEVHVLMSSTPHINHHESQAAAQELN